MTLKLKTAALIGFYSSSSIWKH